MYNFKNKSILITGGTGSFGKAFLKKIIDRKFGFKKIAIFSRDELKQYELQNLFPKKKYPFLRFFIGDVRDKDRFAFSIRDIDIVVHAAALKQVEISEYNPFEFINTNIVGTQNVVDACLSSNVQKAILVSTDKAVAPENLYGATKLCAEKIFTNSNNVKGNKKIDFAVVRYGNVFGSRGSVLHEFIKQKEKKEFLITDLRMTRFHITLDQSVNLVIDAIKKAKGGEIFIPKLDSFYIKDLATAVCKETKIREVGIRPGEKIHETLVSNSENVNLEKRNGYLIVKSKKETNKNKKKFQFSSDKNDNFLTIDQLKKNISLYFKS
jgi:UDP-N-acetylglucosamine 4,6-dehydratase/5-epimerase